MCGEGKRYSSSLLESSDILLREMRSLTESLEREGELEVLGGRRRCEILFPQEQEATGQSSGIEGRAKGSLGVCGHNVK